MDPAELCRIWDVYQPRLLLIARACAGGLWGRGEELAEDAVQEAFIELTAQPIVPRVPLGWLVGVARNRLIDWQRSDQRRQQREMARGQVSERASWFIATECGDTVASEELTLALRALRDQPPYRLTARRQGNAPAAHEHLPPTALSYDRKAILQRSDPLDPQFDWNQWFQGRDG